MTSPETHAAAPSAGSLRHSGFVILLLALFVLSAAPSSAQLSLANDVIHKESGTRLELRGVFDPLPPTGHVPVRAVITSGETRDSRWTFDFSSETQAYRAQNSYRSSFSVDVPARSTQSALFLVPVAVEYGASHSGYYGNTPFRVEVGLGGFGSKSYSDHSRRARGFPAIAISPALADSSITKLNKELQSKGSGSPTHYGSDVEFGSQFEMDDLPEDWLGYSGFDYLLFSHTDWSKLRPGARRGIEQWVQLGGKLHLFAPNSVSDDALGLTEGAATLKKPFGLGRIARFDWDGKELSASTTVGRYWGAQRRETDLFEGHTSLAKGSNYWPLLEVIGERSFASWQVVLFLVVFGILVGPVNLFVLAPSGRRHRLFVTTPLLSLGASGLMVVVILMQDGTGGAGGRFTAVNLHPADAHACVTQEQISRSGVLLSGAFELKQLALMEPVTLPARPWAKLHAGSNSQSVVLVQNGALRSGNYFQSRAEQGQILRSALSTRARIEKKATTAAGEPPALISALGFTVSQVFYVDEAGVAWKSSTSLASGSESVLVKCEMKELRDAWDAAIAPAGSTLRKQLQEQAAGVPRGHFFAKATSAPGFTLDTLPSIRWEQDHIALFGPVAVN